MNKILAVTMGDPRGIGPEIIKKSLSQLDLKHKLLVIGDRNVFAGSGVTPIESVDSVDGRGPFLYDAGNHATINEPSFECVRLGVDLAVSGRISALVTAPISKKKWLEKGIPFRGHTDFLASIPGVDRCAMAFWATGMRVVLYTTHLPLGDVTRNVNRESIESFIRLVDTELSRLFKKKFHFYVCGLNPHAGEDGHIGREEEDVIRPAIEAVRPQVNISGPHPADTVFLTARDDADAVVLAWYHDQGLIPFKMQHLHTGVNITLGLPFIRTSPDHGTAYDIAGKGMANPASMMAAITLADDLIAP